MEYRFKDLRKVPRGTSFHADVNHIARKAVEKIKNPITRQRVTNMINNVEMNKWYGTLDAGNITISFRYGVCQFLKVDITDGDIIFHMTVINENVKFGGKDEGSK